MTKIKTSRSTKNLLSYLLNLFNKKDLSVYQLSLILIVSSSILTILIISTAEVVLETKYVQSEISLLEEKALEDQKSKLKEKVLLLKSFLEFTQHDSISHTQEQLKDKALRYFESIRFGNDGYVFVNTYNGNALLFNGKKLEEPRKMSDLKYPGGITFYETQMNLAKLPEGGSFQYEFMKIDDQKSYPKMSYIMGFDQWGWILGAGDYLENINNEIILKKKNLKNYYFKNLLIGVAVFIPVFIILLIVSSYVAKFIQNQFDKFVNVIRSPHTENNNQPPFNQVYIRELKSIGMDILQTEELVTQFGNIIDQSNNEIYIFLKDSLQFVHANKGAEHNCGYSISELQNMTFYDILPNINSEQFSTLVASIKHKRTEKIQFETLYQRKDKTVYPIDIQLTLSKLNKNEVYVAFIYDITDRKKIENALVNSKNYVQTIFDSTTDAIFIHDSETGKILDINNQMCLMYGYEKSEVIGKTTQPFSANTEPYTEIKAMHWLLKSKTEGKQTFDWMGKHKDGHLFWTEVSITYIKLGNEYRFIATVSNIDDRKKIELELVKHRENLEKLVENRTIALSNSQNALLNLVDDLNIQSLKIDVVKNNLASINTELESFAYSVSHDLRVPLRHIDGFTKLLQKNSINNFNKKSQSYFNNIISSTKQMNELIDGLLIFSRMGRAELKKTKANMKALVDKVMQTFIFDIKETNVTIIVDDMPDAFVDVFLMTQVWENLISNAIKFSSKTKHPKIHIGFIKDEDANTIYFIKDNGAGFDQKYAENAFGVFQRLHNSNEFPGTGIGLATTKRIIMKHGGYIWAEGSINKGASFFFKLLGTLKN